jgi:hypothetical protein
MVEQGTHKPLDVGSNPTLATGVFSPTKLFLLRFRTQQYTLPWG